MAVYAHTFQITVLILFLIYKEILGFTGSPVSL